MAHFCEAKAAVAISVDRRPAREAGADLICFPEMALTGYPPEDLVIRHSFVDDNIAVVRRLARRSGEMTTLVGFVEDRALAPQVDATYPLAQAAAAIDLVGAGRSRGKTVVTI